MARLLGHLQWDLSFTLAVPSKKQCGRALIIHYSLFIIYLKVILSVANVFIGYEILFSLAVL